MNALETALRGVRERGGHAFVPYVTGGAPGVDAALLRRLEAVGADAVEVGIPHSDPIMDGGVIQEASSAALAAGIRPADVLATIGDADLAIPVAVMTYVNPVFRRGVDVFLDDAVAAGVAGAIVPDLPVDEAAPVEAAAAARGVDVVLLAAPGTDPARYGAIAAAAHGFVYCVATYGVTGAREDLGGGAREVVGALRGLTDLPLLVGVGVGTPELAAEACTYADGVIVGSALMAALANGGPGALEDLAAAFRNAIPTASAGA
ncbi:MAG TPA: tryptophan synthase subunit alpha [Actinomycetota bacterium]|nr:tryptophan synthase subunit alpha [Actinomycetota bacterium]